MTKKEKRILLIILIIFVMLIAFGIIRKNIIKKQEDTRELNSIEDLKTPKDVVRYVGGEYITEKESADSNFTLDIYVKFNVDLYTGDTSNESYYKSMTRTMAYVLNFNNFRIVDEEKKILVAVVCDKDNSTIKRTYINGYEDYFARQNSEIEYNKMENTKITDFSIQSPELIELINQKWNKSSVNQNGSYENYKYDIFENEGIAIRSVYKKVFNVVFRYNYTGNIVNNINVEMTENLDSIINILGEPTFDNREISNLIGYKGKDIYVFFGIGEISVYRVENTGSDILLSNLKEFNETKNLKKFISTITSTWQDYDKYDYNENYIDLVYALKGIKFQFNVTASNGVIIYNNYIGDIKELKEYKDTTGIKELYFVNADSVFQEELRRINDVKG